VPLGSTTGQSPVPILEAGSDDLRAARVGGDSVGDAFAAGQTGTDKLASIRLVGLRAGQAGTLTAVITGGPGR
jgi:hypothetical protein